jgi:FG-GAP repeat
VFAATRSRRGGLALSVALLCACAAAPARADVPSAYSVLNLDDPPSSSTNRALGAQVANAGDLDADSRDDLVIGIPGADSGSGEVLAVSAATGATIWRAPAPAEPSNEGNPLMFGSRVAKLGDVAGCGSTHPAGVDCGARAEADGVPEILVSAFGGDVDSSLSGRDQGRVYVLDGRTGAIHRRLRLSSVDLSPITGDRAEFGYAIASAGDLDSPGDGEPDAVVGAPGYDETFDTAAPACDDGTGLFGTCKDAGRVYVFPSAQLGGPASGAPSSDLVSPLPEIRNPAPEEDSTQQGSEGERFGETVSAYGSPQGLLIGAPLADVAGAGDAGAVFLLDGTTNVSARIDPPSPPQADEHFGAGTFGPPAFGNVGGSATPEVIVGAPGFSSGLGRAYLFDGDIAAPSFTPLAVFDDPSPLAGARFGTAMARLVGDMPAIGSPFGGREGAVHIFNPGGTLAQTICDPDRQAGGEFGASVASLGDLNADGFDDLAVGAPGFDSAAVDAGRLYVLTSKGPAAPGATVVCPSAGGSGSGGADTGDEGTVPDDRTVVIARVLRRLVLKADRKRVRKFGSFRLRGVLRASANRAVCQRRQKIALQRRKASGGRFQTFDVAVTRASGRFTARQVGERTYVYRARVAQTARCMGAVSKTAKVSILRRRGVR